MSDVLGDPVWSPAEWAEPARIAVLYGIGVCDMETGIRGPVLAKEIKKAAADRAVKAIVLRADSPGGRATWWQGRCGRLPRRSR